MEGKKTVINDKKTQIRNLEPGIFLSHCYLCRNKTFSVISALCTTL